LKILRVCQETPFPPTNGGRIEPYYLTKEFAAVGHEVTLVCFQSDHRDVTELREWCDLYPLPFRGQNSVLNLAKGVLQKYPINYVKYRNRDMLSRIIGLCRERAFDAVIVDFSALGWYAMELRDRFPRMPILTRWHNLDTLIWERWSRTQSNMVRRRLGNVQTEFVRRFETTLASASTVCVMAGELDTKLLREMAPNARIEFLPMGIDTEHYSAAEHKRRKNVLFMASGYKWHANWDALKWLYEVIMPRVWDRYPATKLCITGGEWRPEMRGWLRDERVILTGFVPDERDVAQDCGVLAVPMRLGGGIKLKILTGLSLKTPVVTTHAGAEGIAELKDGVHCLMADSADEFADALVKLLENPSLAEALTMHGRQLVCDHYDWRILAEKWDKLLRSVVHATSGPAITPDTVLAT
jgi:glycosyltransferase involved in cell wall biosynthesis